MPVGKVCDNWNPGNPGIPVECGPGTGEFWGSTIRQSPSQKDATPDIVEAVARDLSEVSVGSNQLPA